MKPLLNQPAIRWLLLKSRFIYHSFLQIITIFKQVNGIYKKKWFVWTYNMDKSVFVGKLLKSFLPWLAHIEETASTSELSRKGLRHSPAVSLICCCCFWLWVLKRFGLSSSSSLLESFEVLRIGDDCKKFIISKAGLWKQTICFII